MKPLFWISLAMPLAFSPAAARAAQPYEACILTMAQSVLAQTGLNAGPASVADYGHSVYLKYISTYGSGGWDKPGSPIGKGFAPHVFRVQSKTDRTTLAFTLVTRLAEVKRSEFGSGQATVTNDCCSLDSEVLVKDLGSGLTKKFSLRGQDCGKGAKDWSKGQDVVSVNPFRTSLCSVYGKKTESWATEREWTSSGRYISVPCSDDRHKVCREWEPGDDNKTIYRHTGCRVAGGNPEISESNADEVDL